MENLLEIFEVFIKHLRIILIHLMNFEAISRSKEYFLIDLKSPQHSHLQISGKKVQRTPTSLFLVFFNLEIALKIKKYEKNENLFDFYKLINHLLYRKIQNLNNMFHMSCLSYRSLKKINSINFIYDSNGKLIKQEGKLFPELK